MDCSKYRNDEGADNERTAETTIGNGAGSGVQSKGDRRVYPSLGLFGLRRRRHLITRDERRDCQRAGNGRPGQGGRRSDCAFEIQRFLPALSRASLF